MSDAIKTFDCTGCSGYCYGGYHMAEDKEGYGDWVRKEDHHAAQKVLLDRIEALEKAQRFAGLVLRAHRNDGYPGDVDGAELERFALECGMLEIFNAPGPCGERCACAEVLSESEFPTECYRATEAGRAALSATKEST